MPNWFTGNATITHKNSQKMEEFHKFYEENKDKVEQRDNTVGYEFNHKFAPLSSTEKDDDGHPWDYETANKEWGSKWGVAEIVSWYFSGTNTLYIDYNSAWCMPAGIFETLHKQGFIIKSTGYEYGCCFSQCFRDGKLQQISVDVEDLIKFNDEELGEDWVDEDDKESQAWDYMNDYSEHYWDNNLEFDSQ